MARQITNEADDVDYCPLCGKMIITCSCTKDRRQEYQHNEHSGSKAYLEEEYYGAYDMPEELRDN